MLRLTGNVGIGHIRYPTAGGSRASEAQPFYVNSPYGICLGHNGNLTNYDELAELLIERRSPAPEHEFRFRSVAQCFRTRVADSRERQPTPEQIFDAVEAVHRRCSGGYAVVAMIVGIGIVAFRDPNGIRPLVLGRARD